MKVKVYLKSTLKTIIFITYCTILTFVMIRTQIHMIVSEKFNLIKCKSIIVGPLKANKFNLIT